MNAAELFDAEVKALKGIGVRVVGPIRGALKARRWSRRKTERARKTGSTSGGDAES